MKNVTATIAILLCDDIDVISNFHLYLIFIRVFMYPMTPEDLTYNLAATAALFEPVLTEV